MSPMQPPRFRRVFRVVVVAVLLCATTTVCKPKVEPTKQGPIDPSKYAAYLVRYPFGGHRVEWWETRLEELAPAGPHADAALYQLTVERAQQNGLVVTNNNGHVTVVPNPQLATTIIARLGVK